MCEEYLERNHNILFMSVIFFIISFATNVNAFLLAANITCSGADGQVVVPEARPHVPHGADCPRTPRLIRGSTELLWR